MSLPFRSPPAISFATVLLMFIGFAAPAFAESGAEKASQIAELLNSDKRDIDFAEAKLAIDKIIEPTIDAEATLAELAQLSAAARLPAELPA